MKFYPRFIYPFPIIRATSETSSYKLDIPDMYKIHPTFHARLLRLFIPNDPDRFPTRELPRLGPMFENEDGNGDDYKVEFIWDHREMAQGKREFYVHWKGWPTSDDSWVKEKDMNALELVTEYLSSLPTQ